MAGATTRVGAGLSACRGLPALALHVQLFWQAASQLAMSEVGMGAHDLIFLETSFRGFRRIGVIIKNCAKKLRVHIEGANYPLVQLLCLANEQTLFSAGGCDDWLV